MSWGCARTGIGVDDGKELEGAILLVFEGVVTSRVGGMKGCLYGVFRLLLFEQGPEFCVGGGGLRIVVIFVAYARETVA